MCDGHDGYDGDIGIPPCHCCCHGICMQNWRLCPAGDSGDGSDSDIGIFLPSSPFGRTPRKRKMQAWALLAFFGS